MFSRGVGEKKVISGREILEVAIVDGSAAQITTFGGGIQYTEGDTDSTITGTAIVFESNEGTNTLSTVNATTPLPVAVISGGTAGAQYTEDAVAAANPIGTAVNLVRKDTPAGEVSADGDNIAQRGTNYGAAYVTLLDTAGAPVAVGGGTQYTEDAVAAANPIGNMLIVVREDARAGSLVSADGDNVALRGNNKGELYVKHTDTMVVDGSGVTQPVSVAVIPSHAVTNAGTFAVQATIAAATTNIAKAEDAASASADVGVPAMAIQLATPTDLAGTDADYAMLQMAGGRLWVDASGKTLTVGSHAVTNAGTFAVQAAEADGANVTLGAKADAKSTATDTTAISAMSVLKQISASVQAPPSQAVTNAGTFAVQTDSVIPGVGATNLGKREDDAHTSLDTGVFVLGVANEGNNVRNADGDYSSIATDTEGNSRIVGNRDHDAVDAGEVVAVGGQAIAHGTNPTAVSAAADRTRWYFNRAGVPFVIGGHPNIVTLEAAYTAAQTDAAIVTIGAGLKIVVTEIEALCDNANTVNVACRVGFGTANTPTTTGVVLTHPGIAPGTGVVRGNGSGILGVGADNEDLRITCGVPTTGSIRILVSYYTIES